MNLNSIKKYKIEIALIVITLTVVSSYGINTFPILKDHGLYSYIGQELTRGYPPYSTAIDIKAPMTYFVDAFFMNLFFFLPQYLAIRVGMLILISVLVLLYYRTILRISGDKLLSVGSSLVLISFTFFMELGLLGGPKLLTVLFLFSSLFTLLRKNYILSGIFSSLAFLSWQPGSLVIFAPLVFIILGKTKFKEKLKKFGFVLTGFAIPAFIIGLYFHLASSLSDFIEFVILLPISFKSTVSSVNVWDLFNTLGYFCSEVLFLLLGVVGLGYAFYRLSGKKKKWIYEKRDIIAFAAPFLALSIYLSRDFQTGDDLSLLLPAISVLAVLTLVKIITWVKDKIPFKNKYFLPLTLLLIITTYGFFPALQPVYPENPVIADAKDLKGGEPSKFLSKLQEKYGTVGFVSTFMFHRKGEQITVQDQLRVAEYIKNRTDKGEKILSLGSPEIVFLSERRSLIKYPHLKSDVFILHLKKTSSIEDVRKKVINYRPKIMVMKFESSLGLLDLKDFVSENYKKIPGGISTKEYVIYERIE